MSKKLHGSEWFLIVAVVAFFATGAWFYPQLPAQIASHWNTAGQVDGTMSRFWGVYLFPLIFAVLALLLIAIPRIDPKRDNIAKFRKYFDYFVIAFALIFYYIYFLTLYWNLGNQFDFTAALIPPIAALFYIIGAILPHTEPNWTIGIRTPWTISSENVWRRTHQVGGWAFKISAVIAVCGIFFPPAVGVWFLFVPILISALGLVIYSYVLYEREKA